MKLDDIAGRTAFITGGAQGIGLGIARALAAGGARVAIADIDTDALEVAEHELSVAATAMAVRLEEGDNPPGMCPECPQGGTAFLRVVAEVDDHSDVRVAGADDIEPAGEALKTR